LSAVFRHKGEKYGFAQSAVRSGLMEISTLTQKSPLTSTSSQEKVIGQWLVNDD